MRVIGFRLITLLLLTYNIIPCPINIPKLPSFAPIMAEEHRDWDEIKSSTHEFEIELLAQAIPKKFLWGVGTSDIQMNGHRIHQTLDIEHTSKWTHHNIIQELGADHINPAYNGIEDPEEYVHALKEAGFNTYRFSIESSKVMPRKGEFDEQAMEFYKELRYHLLQNGITPIYTLYHHDEPEDFYLDGSFENDENIDHFAAFAEFVFHQFANDERVEEHEQIWLTFNEPVGYALGAYVDGRYPPYKKVAIHQCGNVVKNMIITHCAIYDAFHKANDETYGNKFDLSLGIAKVFNPIKPYKWYNPGDQLAARMFNHLLHEPFMQFFKTGKFSWLKLVSYEDREAPGKLDFIGVNYYSHTLLSNFQQRNRENEITADKHNPNKASKTIYAEGLDWSLKYAAQLGKPIMVTKLGFATEDKEKRTEYINRHMYVLAKNIQEGLPINGCLWWTLFNNSYEWGQGNSSKHGLFEYNEDGVIQRNESAESYFSIIEEWRKLNPTMD